MLPSARQNTTGVKPVVAFVLDALGVYAVAVLPMSIVVAVMEDARITVWHCALWAVCVALLVRLARR